MLSTQLLSILLSDDPVFYCLMIQYFIVWWSSILLSDVFDNYKTCQTGLLQFPAWLITDTF